MSIYATASLAGSAGKTTSIVSLAILCASRGARVRLIDIDPQGNASKQLGYVDLDEHSLTAADVLAGPTTIEEVERPALVPVEITETGEPVFDDESEIENLTIVPAYFPTLTEMQIRLASKTGGVTQLRRAIAAAPPVDVTLIDAPGVDNALTLSAILASQADNSPSSGVLTNTFAGSKEVEGLSRLESMIAAINEDREMGIKLQGIMVCNVPPHGNLYKEYVRDLGIGYGDLVAPPISHGVAVPEAYSYFTPVPLYRRAHQQTVEYNTVLDHFIGIGLFPEVKAS